MIAIGGRREIIYPPHYPLTGDFSLLRLDLPTPYRKISSSIILTISCLKPIASKYISVCNAVVDNAVHDSVL